MNRELTGIEEAKYLAHTLLGFLRPRTFPVTENLIPDGSVTMKKQPSSTRRMVKNPGTASY
jgi:glycine cleavage system protein P-like pyridoxal-binding family